MNPPVPILQKVQSEGPEDAAIVAIGESPWVQEVAAGRPFVGQSGYQWGRWLDAVGLDRRRMRVMNLYPFKPPRREVDSIPVETLIEWMRKLHERVAELKGPKVLVPMGNYATFALTGKGKVKSAVRNSFAQWDGKASEAERKAGISSLRGSIYPYRDLRGREMKVIPVIHPAAVLQMMKWNRRCERDWARIGREAAFEGVRDPGRQHIIEPSEEQVAEFVRIVESGGRDIKLAVDIETWGKQLSCVGFAYHPYESITINLIGERNRRVFEPWVKRLCASEAEKILCGG